MFKPQRIATVLALATALTTSPAFGQRRRQQGASLPQPYLQSVLPLGVRAGGSAEVTLRGNDLEGVTSLWFDHPGLKAEHVKGLTFKIACAAGAPVGHHDVRAVGTYGVSNPRAFVVGDRPESSEVEPNNTPAEAKPIAVNSVVNGEVGPTDVDCFAFEGKKGQRLLFDLEAERVDSRLDATLRLLDAEGRDVAESRDVFGADPFLDVTLPADGRYVVKVHDVIYRGSSDHTYRLTLTDGPHLDAVVPAVARAGETTTFTLIGRNLGGEPAPDLAADGRPLERKAVTLTAPGLDPEPPSRGFVPSPGAARRGFEYALSSPSGSSNPVFIALATDPVVVEHEPNDDAAHAQEVTLPCDVSGTFGAAGDRDVYRFRAKKGEVWVVDAGAERIGSPADLTVSLQKVDAKGNEQDLMTGEDTPDRGGQTRFPTATYDASLRWTAPDDGAYQVAVSDLYGSQRGDARLSYRLNIRRERPDFHLFVVPDSPNQPDALTVHAGGRATAYAVAVRSDGFNGPIRVEAADLPPSVRCEPAVIPAGQSQAPVVFEAGEDVKPLTGTVRLVGRARFGDRKEALGYVPGATPLGPDVSHAAVAGAIVWPTAGANPQQPNQSPLPLARVTRGFALKVVDPAPLALTVSPARRNATPGGLLALDLSVTRRAGFAEAVAVSLFNPLPGMPNNNANPNAPPPPLVTIPKASTTGALALKLPGGLAPGVYTLVFQGTGPYPFSKDPKAKTKPNVTLTEPSNPLTLVVRPAPASVAVGGGGKTIKAGGRLEVDVTVRFMNGASGPIDVSLAAPASLKLTAEPVSARPGQPVKLVVTAAPDSPPGPATVGVRATVPVRGEPVDVDELLALTIAK